MEMERTVLKREQMKMKTELGEASVKMCTLPNGKLRCYPEYEDVKKIAKRQGISYDEVYRKDPAEGGGKQGKSKVREALASKRNEMEQWLRKEIKEDCAVAFSGGVDSALLLKLVCDAAKGSKANVYAVTMQTTLHPAAEITHAKKVAEEIGARHLIVPVDELAEAGMQQNPVIGAIVVRNCCLQS